jgi:hypothetical protein
MKISIFHIYIILHIDMFNKVILLQYTRLCRNLYLWVFTNKLPNALPISFLSYKGKLMAKSYSSLKEKANSNFKIKLSQQAELSHAINMITLGLLTMNGCHNISVTDSVHSIDMFPSLTSYFKCSGLF